MSADMLYAHAQFFTGEVGGSLFFIRKHSAANQRPRFPPGMNRGFNQQVSRNRNACHISGRGKPER